MKKKFTMLSCCNLKITVLSPLLLDLINGCLFIRPIKILLNFFLSYSFNFFLPILLFFIFIIIFIELVLFSFNQKLKTVFFMTFPYFISNNWVQFKKNIKKTCNRLMKLSCNLRMTPWSGWSSTAKRKNVQKCWSTLKSEIWKVLRNCHPCWINLSLQEQNFISWLHLSKK